MHPRHSPPGPIPTAMTANPALRIYNSVTQAHALTPASRLIRAWVSGLRSVSDIQSQDDACRVKTLIIYKIKEAS